MPSDIDPARSRSRGPPVHDHLARPPRPATCPWMRAEQPRQVRMPRRSGQRRLVKGFRLAARRRRAAAQWAQLSRRPRMPWKASRTQRPERSSRHASPARRRADRSPPLHEVGVPVAAKHRREAVTALRRSALTGCRDPACWQTARYERRLVARPSATCSAQARPPTRGQAASRRRHAEERCPPVHRWPAQAPRPPAAVSQVVRETRSRRRPPRAPNRRAPLGRHV